MKRDERARSEEGILIDYWYISVPIFIAILILTGIGMFNLTHDNIDCAGLREQRYNIEQTKPINKAAILEMDSVIDCRCND